MNSKDFDQLLREKLNGHAVTPDPKVWNAIQQQVQSSSRRHYAWWGAFALLVLGAAAYLLWPTDSDTPTYPTNTSTSEVLNESPESTSHDESPTALFGGETTSSTPLTGESEMAPGQPTAPKASPRTVIAENRNSESGENTLTANSKKSSNPSASADKSKASSAQAGMEDGNSSQKESAMSAADSKTQQEKASKNQRSPEASTNSNISVNSQANKSSFPTQDKQNDLIDEENERLAATSPLWNTLQEGAPFGATSEELDYTAGFKGFQTEAFLNLERRQKNALRGHDLCDMLFPSLEDCPKFGDRRRRYQIDAYTQTGVLFSHLTNNFSSEEIGTYLGQRRSTETPLWHIGFGVRLSTQWTNGISMRGGLQISQSKIRVDYVDETERQTTVNVSIDTLVDDQGNTTVVWDTISIVETGVEDRRHYNTFTQIDIPLTVGYTFLGPRYDVEVNGGVMFNLLFQREGSVFGPEDEFYELGQSNPPAGQQAYDQKLGLSIIGSVALNYHLSPQFSLFVEPQLRYFLDPVSPGDYALHESWFIGSLMMGGRYSF